MKRTVVAVGILLVFASACESGSSHSAPGAGAATSTPVSTNGAPVDTQSQQEKAFNRALQTASAKLACQGVKLAIAGIKAGDSSASIQRQIESAANGFETAGATEFVTELRTAEFAPSSSITQLRGIVKQCKAS